jgi:hypothetical protein
LRTRVDSKERERWRPEEGSGLATNSIVEIIFGSQIDVAMPAVSHVSWETRRLSEEETTDSWR